MDSIADSDHTTLKQIGIALDGNIPGYVLNSHMLDKEATAGLSDNEFADDVRRLFPITSPADTWLSAAYFSKNAEACGYRDDYRACVAGRLRTAARIYGIEKDVNALTTSFSKQAADAHPEDDDANYGWVNGAERKYPMFDAEGVKLAASHFSTYMYRYPANMRTKVAATIVTKAEAYGVPLTNPSIRKEAHLGMPRRDTLMAELLERAKLVRDPEASLKIAEINSLVAVCDMPELVANLEKIATVLDIVDVATGMDRQYGKKLLAPAEFLYDIDMKQADAMADDAVYLGNDVFSLTKLAELDADDYAAALGDDFVTRIKSASGTVSREKLGDELNSLPTPDKNALKSHLRAKYA